MKKLFYSAAVALTLAAALTVQAIDQSRPVMDVLIADTNGDLDGFLDRMKRLEGEFEQKLRRYKVELSYAGLITEPSSDRAQTAVAHLLHVVA